MNDPLVAVFPGLAMGGYRVTSPATDRYNCIAWAAGRDDRWWEPGHADAFWPADAPAARTLAAFEAAYRTLGYEPYASERFELRFEKVAIFTNPAGVPTHAARQLDNGRWTSKLGRDVDIEHATPHALNGPDYGAPALFMRRRRSPWRLMVALLRRLAAS